MLQPVSQSQGISSLIAAKAEGSGKVVDQWWVRCQGHSHDKVRSPEPLKVKPSCTGWALARKKLHIIYLILLYVPST